MEWIQCSGTGEEPKGELFHDSMKEWLMVATPYEIGVIMAKESVSRHLGVSKNKL